MGSGDTGTPGDPQSWGGETAKVAGKPWGQMQLGSQCDHLSCGYFFSFS